MKKIILLSAVILSLAGLNAQIVYQTVLTDNFETTDGYPANFTVKAQQAWVTLNTTTNPNPYTGTIWKDMYSDVKPTAKKSYISSIVQENRTGGTGSQCIKFDIKNETFTDVMPNDSVMTLRWRGADGKISFNTAAFEGLTKYEVSFWARTDGEDKEVIMNTKSPLTKLKLTSNWQKYTIERYTTGTTSTALGIDFTYTLYPALDNTTGFTVYMDEFVVKQRKIAYTAAATNISVNGFTANWSAVSGATAYSLIVEKTDGAATPTWTPVVGSPFNAGNATTYNVANLDAGGTYRYRAIATDGSVTTVESNNTFVTTTASGLKNTQIKSLSLLNGTLTVLANPGKEILLYNINGQLLKSFISVGDITNIQLKDRGVYIVKVENDVRKIITP